MTKARTVQLGWKIDFKFTHYVCQLILMTLRLVDEHSFKFEQPTIEQPARRQPLLGLCCGTLITFVLAIVLACKLVWSPPPWLQPSIIGMIWGSLFLAGAAAGSVRRGNMQFVCAASSYVWLCQLVIQSLTSLVAAESGLVVVFAFAAGWLMTQLEFSGRPEQLSATSVRRFQQWTIWDIALLTTLVAVICYGVPRIESPIPTLCNVGFVLWGGCLSSWTAYRWVFDDCWTIRKLSILAVVSAVCFWLLNQQTPTDFSLLHILLWMFTDSLAVVAAQFFSVLALLTSIRIDRRTLIGKRLDSAGSQFNVV